MPSELPTHAIGDGLGFGFHRVCVIKRSVKPTDAVGSVGCKRPLTLCENILSGSGIESYVKQKRDEALPLGKSMTPEAQPIAFGVGG